MGDIERLKRVRMFPALVVGICMLGAACSSSSSSKSATTTQPTAAISTTTVPSTPTTVHTKAQDTATAQSVVLKASDLPGAWVAGPTVPNDQTGDKQVTQCLGIGNSDLFETAYAGSPQFAQGAVQLDTSTSVYDSAAIVANDLRGATSPKFVSCESQLLASVSNGAATNIHLTKVALPTTAGDLKGFRFTGTFGTVQNGKQETVSFDEVALEHGRVELGIDLVAVNGTLPAGLMDHVTAALAPRLRATPAT